MPQEGPKTPPNAKTALAVLAALVGVGTAASLVSDTKKDEGVVHVAYRDLGGVWSICSGSTHGVAPGETDTDEQCDARTADDLAKAARIVLAVSPRLKAPDMHQQLRAVIRFQNNTGKYPVSCDEKGDPLPSEACSFGPPNEIYMPNPCSFPPSDDYARLMCHEIGHLNGWPDNHPR
jgi:hypothetical protein